MIDMLRDPSMYGIKFDKSEEFYKWYFQLEDEKIKNLVVKNICLIRTTGNYDSYCILYQRIYLGHDEDFVFDHTMCETMEEYISAEKEGIDIILQNINRIVIPLKILREMFTPT